MADRRSVVSIVRQDLFGTSEGDFRSPLHSSSIAESGVTRDQHAGGSKIGFLQGNRFFKIPYRLVELMLPKSHQSSRLVNLVRFGIETQSNFDFTRGLVVAFFVQKYS